LRAGGEVCSLRLSYNELRHRLIERQICVRDELRAGALAVLLEMKMFAHVD